MDYPLPAWPVLVARSGHIEATLEPSIPPLRQLRDHPSTFTLHPEVTKDVPYLFEEAARVHSVGDTWSPGYYKLDLDEGATRDLDRLHEPNADLDALATDEAYAAELQRRTRLLSVSGPQASRPTFAAARTGGRPIRHRAGDAAPLTPTRAHAAGEEARSVIAGYHWFTDWGRDTMISLEGLTLCTGRHAEAADILLRSPLPSRRSDSEPVSEGDQEGLYHTADATLWFFHAHRSLRSVTTIATRFGTACRRWRRSSAARRGTHFGIHVDRGRPAGARRIRTCR